MASLSSSVIVFKQPLEKIKTTMDFSTWLDTGITISNPVVTSLFYGCDTTDLIIANVAVAIICNQFIARS